MQKIGPCLWFDNEAEEAAHFYVSVFKNSRVVSTTRYMEGAHRPAGSVMTVQFIVDGEESHCGWLNDRFGVSLQIVPTVVIEMLSSTDSAARQRAFTAMLPIGKLETATATPDVIEVFGDTAYLWGSYFERLAFPGQPGSEQHGKFVIEWMRGREGAWLIQRCLRVPVPDPAATEPRDTQPEESRTVHG